MNKLLVDLSKAKNEVLGARTQNRDQQKVLNERIASLEDELESTNVELIRAVREFEDLKLQVARRNLILQILSNNWKKRHRLHKMHLEMHQSGNYLLFHLLKKWKVIWLNL